MAKKVTTKLSRKRLSIILNKPVVRFTILLAVIGLCLFIATYVSRHASYMGDKEQHLFNAYKNELKSLGNPFEAFGIEVEQPNPDGTCKEIDGMDKLSNGDIRTRYRDAKRCDITQAGGVVLTEANQRRIATYLQKIDLNEHFIKNGWRHDTRFGVNEQTPNQKLTYIMQNLDSVLLQVNKENVQPTILNGTYYTKTIDAKTNCNFSVSHEPRAQDTEEEPDVVIWDKIVFSLSMTCSYDNQ